MILHEDFQRAAQAVTAEQAAIHYGVEVRGHKCRCIFHSPDRHPSMSFKANFFHCFTCGAGGDSIKLTAQLLGLDQVGALRRLNDDFRLGLSLDGTRTAEELKAAQRAAQARQTALAKRSVIESARLRLAQRMRLAHVALKATDRPLTDEEAQAIKDLAQMEHADIVLENDEADDTELLEVVGWIKSV